MKEQLQALVKDAKKAIESTDGLKNLEELRVKYLGKKGEITSLKKNISKLSNEEKPMAGKLINEISKEVE
ncbi:MAG: phenylalanine--tRNA ligase subunit alpha, partial [Anaerococcus vaginalis]|nr:phenylalanine--tRNA ligase subunit alpha [Anaerococcus vaginalis]